MKKIVLKLASIFLIGGNIMMNTSNSQSGTLTEQIDAFVGQQLERHNLPGLALAVTQGDQVIHLKGYGTSEDNQPITPQTQFYLASVSKSITALAVMQLVEAGKVELDTPVQNYLPEFMNKDPAAAEQVTIRQLLNHTSGMADEGFQELRLPQMRTLADRLNSLRSARPVAEPGTEFHYFNSNYDTLGRLVEVVSGKPFADYLQENIFSPLRMTDTFHVTHSGETAGKAARLAQGHILPYGIPVPANEMNGFIGGSGGVISTVEDLVKFLIMWNRQGRMGSEALISPQSIAAMQTAPTGIESNYAMGWIVSQESSPQILEHNGIFSAFYAEVVLLPEDDIGIALLYNASSFPATAFAFPQIKNGLIELLTGRQPETGGFSVTHWGILIGLLTLTGSTLAIRSLRQLPKWSNQAVNKPVWQLIPGIIWKFVPSGVLIGMPWLVAAGSGRVFAYSALWRSMPDVFLWLGMTGALGMVNGFLRLRWILNRRLPS